MTLEEFLADIFSEVAAQFEKLMRFIKGIISDRA